MEHVRSRAFGPFRHVARVCPTPRVHVSRALCLSHVKLASIDASLPGSRGASLVLHIRRLAHLGTLLSSRGPAHLERMARGTGVCAPRAPVRVEHEGGRADAQGTVACLGRSLGVRYEGLPLRFRPLRLKNVHRDVSATTFRAHGVCDRNGGTRRRAMANARRGVACRPSYYTFAFWLS